MWVKLAIMVNRTDMDNEPTSIYKNEFFDSIPDLQGDALRQWIEKQRTEGRSEFKDFPCLKTLTKREVWQDMAKFYFLPFMINCYKFTRQNELPRFALMVSPTMMFYRDRLHLRNFPDTIHRAFFACLDMCIPKGEEIMLLVEKRFHIVDPIDGGTQQLYNMLWDYDLTPKAGKVILPKPPPRLGMVDVP